MNEELFEDVHVLTSPDHLDEIGSLLKAWEVPQSVIHRFQENEIKPNQLSHLSEELLKELCPVIGHRILIKSKLDEYFTGHNFGDIGKKIEDFATVAQKQKHTLQPFLISCGSAGDNCRKYYLVIDKVKYRFESATKAFDTLFKSYHALHASYPAASAHFYLLIQRCVYGFVTKYDNVVPYISDVLSIAQNI